MRATAVPGQPIGTLADGTPFFAPLGELVRDGEEWVVCHLCGRRMKMLGGTHLRVVHGWTLDAYRETFQLHRHVPTCSVELSDRYRVSAQARIGRDGFAEPPAEPPRPARHAPEWRSLAPAACGGCVGPAAIPGARTSTTAPCGAAAAPSAWPGVVRRPRAESDAIDPWPLSGRISPPSFTRHETQTSTRTLSGRHRRTRCGGSAEAAATLGRRSSPIGRAGPAARRAGRDDAHGLTGRDRRVRLGPVDTARELGRPELDQPAALPVLVLAALESHPADGLLLRVDDQQLLHPVGGVELELVPALIAG
jgi:ROS/MUCR transcriptional regulator protein